jgi:hypothetical protein
MLVGDHSLKSLLHCVCCYNRRHGNAVEGFWALWDNIYDCVCCYNRFHGNAVKPYVIIFMTMCVYFRFTRHTLRVIYQYLHEHS